MIHKTLFLLFGLFLISMPEVAVAEDYYISPSGNDDNPGTESVPWRSIGKANQTLSQGDTAVIRGGTYNETIRPSSSGTENAQITYRGYIGETAMISNVSTGANLDNRDWIVIDNLSFENCRSHFVYGTNSHHILIEGCSFNNTSMGSGWSGVGGTGSHITIRGCTFGQWGNDTGGGDFIHFWPADYCVIEDNDFHDARSGHAIINGWGSYMVIRNNYFQNLWQKILDIGERIYEGVHHEGRHYLIEGNTFNISVYDYEDDGTLIQGYTYESIFRNNVFVAGEHWGIHMNCWGSSGDSDISTGFPRNRIYNNVFANNKKAGIAFHNYGASDSEKDIEGNKIFNNIFLNNGERTTDLWGGEGPYSGLHIMINFVNNDFGETHVLNNLFFQSSGLPNVIGVDGYGVEEPVWWNNNYSSNFAFNLNANPELSDPENLEFTLESGSPCIDEGIFLTETTASGNGSTLTVEDSLFFSDGFDVVDGDLIQLEGQSQTARIVDIDYASNQLLLETPLTWTAGQGVSLRYSGDSPDIGAFEYGQGDTDSDSDTDSD